VSRRNSTTKAVVQEIALTRLRRSRAKASPSESAMAKPAAAAFNVTVRPIRMIGRIEIV